MAGKTGDLNIFLERVNILMYLWSGRERMKTRYYEVFYIILNTGMRIGELAALMWEDIDFHAHRIRIYKTLNKTTIFYDDSKRRIRWIQMKQKMKIPCRNRAVTLPKAAQMQINQGVLAKEWTCRPYLTGILYNWWKRLKTLDFAVFLDYSETFESGTK